MSKANAPQANAPETKPPAPPRGRQSQRKRLPTVVKGEHPIRKEKAAAERRALAKRLKGEKADYAADKMERAERGRGGRPGKPGKVTGSKPP